MTLKTTIAGAAQAAFKSISSLSSAVVVYRDQVGENYTTFDHSSGGGYQSYTDYQIDLFVLSDFSQKEINAGIAGPKDKKLIFPQSELAVVPNPAGSVLINSALYNLSGDSGSAVRADPAEATWTLRIQKA